jgi:hypothetical protein
MYAAANAVGGAKTRDRQREWGGLQQEPNFGTPQDVSWRRVTAPFSIVGAEASGSSPRPPAEHGYDERDDQHDEQKLGKEDASPDCKQEE